MESNKLVNLTIGFLVTLVVAIILSYQIGKYMGYNQATKKPSQTHSQTTKKTPSEKDILDEIAQWTPHMQWSDKASDTTNYQEFNGYNYSKEIVVTGYSRLNTMDPYDKNQYDINQLESSTDTRLTSQGWVLDPTNSAGGSVSGFVSYIKQEGKYKRLLRITGSQTYSGTGVQTKIFYSDPFLVE